MLQIDVSKDREGCSIGRSVLSELLTWRISGNLSKSFALSKDNFRMSEHRTLAHCDRFSLASKSVFHALKILWGYISKSEFRNTIFVIVD